MARLYATPDDLAEYTGQAAPDDAAVLLARASRLLDSAVLRLCWYRVDGGGMPADPAVLGAVRDACCAQAQWWGELGDSIGAAGAGWGSVAIGGLSMSRPTTSTDGRDSAARQIAPQVWDALQSPDLTPDRFLLGAVVT